MAAAVVRLGILDVGCGWGGFVIHAAKTYGVAAVGITLLTGQASAARARVAVEGLGELVKIRFQDYRQVADGPYDAIASIGMAEHVGLANLPRYAGVTGRRSSTGTPSPTASSSRCRRWSMRSSPRAGGA